MSGFNVLLNSSFDVKEAPIPFALQLRFVKLRIFNVVRSIHGLNALSWIKAQYLSVVHSLRLVLG